MRDALVSSVLTAQYNLTYMLNNVIIPSRKVYNMRYQHALMMWKIFL